MTQEISIEDFVKTDKNNLQVIDIREQYEHENGSIDSINIPMDEILKSIASIDHEKQVIIYCQTGKRAAAVTFMLHKQYGLKNIFNLAGGYSAYLDSQIK